MGGLFGAASSAAEPPIDLKVPHAAIGRMTLKDDFFEGAFIAA